MTEEDFKQLLEETYKDWYTEETDDYGDSLHWQALLVIEEIYTDIFGQEEFDEFVKRIRNGNWKDVWLYRIISPSRIP